MIERLTEKWLDLLDSGQELDIQEREVYQYGMELLLSTVLNFGLMVIVSVCITQMAFAFIPYTIVYVPLRLSAGGYHAKSHWACVLYTQGTFVLSVLLTKFMAGHAVPCVLPAIAVSVFVIWFLAPVEAKNKPLSQGEWKKAKQRSHILELLFVLVVAAFTYLNKLHMEFILAGIAANLSVAVSLVTAKIDEVHGS